MIDTVSTILRNLLNLRRIKNLTGNYFVRVSRLKAEIIEFLFEFQGRYTLIREFEKVSFYAFKFRQFSYYTIYSGIT